MLYLFYGTDVEKVRAKAFEWVAKARAKEPNLAYVRLAKEELSSAALLDAALSGGLFVKRLLVLIDDPYQKVRAASEEEEGEAAEAGSAVDEQLDALADSDNAIVLLAPKLPSVKAKKIAGKAKVAYEFNARLAPSEARGFNSALVNALAAKNREKLWLETARALRAGDAPEMLHGLLHWKARDLLEKGGRDWKRDEARQLSLDLIRLVQDSRRKGLDLSESLERFALSI